MRIVHPPKHNRTERLIQNSRTPDCSTALVSACRIGLFSIEHVELGATLILDALAKTALEHSHMEPAWAECFDVGVYESEHPFT
jgi:hypothetical protein